MKPVEFLKKYNLSEGWKPKKQDKFLEDMKAELIDAMEYFKVHHPGTEEYEKSGENVKGFLNSVEQIKQKWTGISNKVPYGLPDTLWNYFYATVIIPMKEEYLPKETERKAEKQKAWESRKNTKKEEQK